MLASRWVFPVPDAMAIALVCAARKLRYKVPIRSQSETEPGCALARCRTMCSLEKGGLEAFDVEFHAAVEETLKV
jgi:hypothetical protein